MPSPPPRPLEPDASVTVDGLDGRALAPMPAAAPRWGVAELTMLGANLLPLAGLLFLGWEPLEVMILYWVESVIVWLYTLLKILMVLDPGTGAPGSRRAGRIVGRLLSGAFMMTQFALGLFVYGWAILGVFGGPEMIGEMGGDPAVAITRMLAAAAGSPVAWALVASHGCEFVMEHRRTHGFHDLDFGGLVFSGFRRLVPVHLMLMIAALPVMLLGAPAIGIAVLVVLKIVADLRQLRRERSGDAAASLF
ncbi:MAG TPA: DUF6498-containing protein [Longimicrobium sp.]|nr:DUF6498-containing protein [Longimicrobium sp.]